MKYTVEISWEGQKETRQLGRPRLRWVDNIVAYLLKAKTVKVEKQSLLGNGPYTSSRGTRQVRCDIAQQ
jgi:hypothetical protein